MAADLLNLDDAAFPLERQLRAKSLSLSQRATALVDTVDHDFAPFVHLPDLTDHGVKHARNVLENLSRLIPVDMPEPLSAFELFCLLCAAHLHDVGMAVSKSMGESPWLVRFDHYERSREFVLKNRAVLGLSEHEANVIAEICRAHGMPNLGYLRGTEFSLRGYGAIRVQLLSALLRLADALDLTSDRAPASISANRTMSGQSRKHWNVHACVSNVHIDAVPSWDIRIVASPKRKLDVQHLHELRNAVQDELEIVYPVLRAEGLFFKKVELALNWLPSDPSVERRTNPFLLLRPFEARSATLFAGRDREIQQVIERILGRRLVVLIGESGVGKTSLMQAGVIPGVREYGYRVISFSFQRDPLDSLRGALQKTYGKQCARGPLVESIQNCLSARQKSSRMLIMGDSLEQMFTVRKATRSPAEFIQHILRVLGNPLPVTFVFCLREDYLPDLYNLSQDFPDLYDRDNTFRLHRLSEDNAIKVLERASQHAFTGLSGQLIQDVVQDLSAEGDGMIYPPFLQIVGYRLYAAFHKQCRSETQLSAIREGLYHKLGRAESIVNQYLDGLLDRYSHQDKPMVGQILNKMVTEFYTKKRIRKDELAEALPECHNLDQLLRKLVDDRIVRRSLSEYELVHDFLARRVIRFIEEKRFMSPPVRRAMEFIEGNSQDTGLSSAQIARAAGVSQMHLAVLFRTQLGCSINRQLNRIRTARAKDLLKSRDPVGDVVQKAGFRSPSAFSRKFKEIEGLSPREYRKTFLLPETPRLDGR